MLTVEQDIEFNIRHWEGGYSDHPGDSMNWIDGKMIGTMHGVTGAALASYRGVLPSSITADDVKSVTWAEAARIGRVKFYDGWFDKIEWNALTSVVVDFGWGTGPGQAVKSTERDFLGLDNADFKFDPRSIAAYTKIVQDIGLSKAIWKFYDVREAFYDLICRLNPTLGQFRIGWGRRSKFFTPVPDSPWWANWSGDVTKVAMPDGSPVVAIPRVVSEGMIGADVAAIQKALATLTHKPFDIAADGIFGPKTTEAVKKFQEMRGIEADGWVGPVTRRFLFGNEHA